MEHLMLFCSFCDLFLKFHVSVFPTWIIIIECKSSQGGVEAGITKHRNVLNQNALEWCCKNPVHIFSGSFWCHSVSFPYIQVSFLITLVSFCFIPVHLGYLPDHSIVILFLLAPFHFILVRAFPFKIVFSMSSGRIIPISDLQKGEEDWGIIELKINSRSFERLALSHFKVIS